MAQPLCRPAAPEAQVLAHLRVRLVTAAERPRWNAEVAAHHYLKNATLVGEHLCYVAEAEGAWLALLGWSAPARHLRPRDAWIGWSDDQLASRRHLLANHARFCVLADPQQLPNLATRALTLCAARLAADWQAHWGHPVVAVESFVDAQQGRGTAYKAAGWRRLDDTSGYARVAEDFYERHERPKQLWVRALDDAAFRALRAPRLPPPLAALEAAPPPPRARCPVAPRRLVALLERLPADVPDPRGAQGRWHPWRAVLGILALAKLCGVVMGQRQIAEFARHLSRPQRRALGCRRAPAPPAHYAVPAESTFQRALATVNPRRFEPLLLEWQHRQLGPDPDELIAIDGKRLRRSGGLAIAGAVGQPSQRVHATVTLGKHESEIIAVRQLLARTEFTGRLLALDSLHTQHVTLQQILYDHGADYLVPLKENQPTILATAKTLLPEDFSPQAALAHPLYQVSGLCEHNRGRRVERWIIVREVTPAQLGLPGAAQLALILRTVTERGQTTTTRHYVVTSRPAARLSPTQILQLRRGQWGIEAVCHQQLDVSLHEDQSRVRSASGVAVLGVLARISLALFAQAAQRPQPVRDRTYPVWAGRLQRQPRPMLDRLLERCLPP